MVTMFFAYIMLETAACIRLDTLLQRLHAIVFMSDPATCFSSCECLGEGAIYVKSNSRVTNVLWLKLGSAC